MPITRREGAQRGLFPNAWKLAEERDRYRTRPKTQEVTARRYWPADDLRHRPIPGVEDVPVCEGGRSPRMGEEPKGILGRVIGTHRYLIPGEWIVTDDEGRWWIVTDAEFRANYEPLPAAEGGKG